MKQAYHSAQWQAGQANPLIVGWRISLSNNHTTLKNGKPTPFRDMCDELVGEYPKDFKFTGWHPQCRCVMTPILATPAERKSLYRSIFEQNGTTTPPPRPLPNNFKQWLQNNKRRIEQAKTTPLFLQQNKNVIQKNNQHAKGDRGDAREQARERESLTERIARAEAKYKQYDPKQWHRAYFNKNTGGYIVTQHERIKESKRNTRERAVFEKELSMSKVLANNGYKVEYLSGTNRPKGATYDILMNGIPTDLKSVSKAGNLIKQIKHALRDQGAKAVVVRLENDKLLDKLLEARRKIKQGRILYYIGKSQHLHELF